MAQIRIGEAYQAVLPDCDAPDTLYVPMFQQGETLLWTAHTDVTGATGCVSPLPLSLIADGTVAALVGEFTAGRPRPDLVHEAVLHELHRHSGDVASARAAIAQRLRTPPESFLYWTDREAQLFEQGMAAVGKKFHAICAAFMVRRWMCRNSNSGCRMRRGRERRWWSTTTFGRKARATPHLSTGTADMHASHGRHTCKRH